MKKPRVGAQLYTVRHATRTIPDIVETFRKVREIGYTSVQVSAFGPVDKGELTRAIRDSGLRVDSTHAGWERFLNDLDALIEEHKAWGCRHPAVGSLPGEYRTADGLKRFLDELAPVAARLAKEGMDFSYHNHDFEFARHNGRTWLRALYEDAPPAMLKAELDTYWIQSGGGSPAAWLKFCAGRMPVIHLKDMIFVPGEGKRMAEVGEGNLDWPAILKAAAEGGVETMFVEQDDGYGKDPFDCLAVSYRNLKAMGYA
ncbi:MAG: sugar phosphate isomerase/epimerase [Lentisphaerae bacterium]|nr:sugar phosphate isomerase/epimerase [Lentisphaerota bacterium]